MVVAFVVLVMPTAALAEGEQYRWADPEKKTIAAERGAFAEPATFTRDEASSAEGGAVFTAPSVTLSCSPTGTQKATARLVLSPEQYRAAADTGGKLEFPSAETDCPPGTSKPTFSDGTVKIAKGSAVPGAGTPVAAVGECDGGFISWFGCPLVSSLAHFAGNLIQSVLEPLLQIEPLSLEGDSGLRQTWSHIRDFARVLFIVVFLLIIYSTVTGSGLSNYNIKRMLPRMVAASILVEASFLICAGIIDAGNILGSGINSLINAATNPDNITTNPLANFAASVTATILGFSVAALGAAGAFALFAGPGGLLALVGILLGLVASVLVTVLILGARYLALAVLIGIAPLAFVAWVLPNTERYFRNWRSAFLRLVMMYPIIMGIIALASRVNELLGQSGEELTTNSATELLTSLTKLILIIATFLVIPLTFKWAGAAMGQIGDAFNGVTRQGVNRFNNSSIMERSRGARRSRQVSAMSAFMNSDRIRKLEGRGAAGRTGARAMSTAWAAALGGAPTTREMQQRAFAQQVSSSKKDLETLDESKNPYFLTKALESVYENDDTKRQEARKELEHKAPSLLRYTTTRAGRMSIVNMLADNGNIDNGTMERIRRAEGRGVLTPNAQLGGEYTMALAQAGKARKEHPLVMVRTTEPKAEYEVKDGGGNVINYSNPYVTSRMAPDAKGNLRPVIERSVGDLDINVVGTNIRNKSAKGLKEDFNGRQLEVMFPDTNDPKMPVEVKRQVKSVAKDSFFAFKENAQIKAFETLFDPKSDYALDTETKLGYLKAFSANAEMTQTGRGRALRDVIEKSIQRDADFRDFAAKSSGAAPYITGPMDEDERKNLALSFLNGKKYNASHDYKLGPE